MKRTTTFLCLCLFLLSAFTLRTNAQDTPTSIECQAGKLEELAKGKDLLNLQLTGELNANDLGFLRNQTIKKLDMTEVTFVEGGEYEGLQGAKETVKETNAFPAAFLANSKLAESIESFVMPQDLTKIGARCLQGAVKLTELSLPVSLEKIGDFAFCKLSALPEIEIPEGVTKVGNGAFWSCKALGQVFLPDGLEMLGESAFQDCTALTELTIPEGITEIPADICNGCINLASINFSEYSTIIGNRAFKNCKALSSTTNMMLVKKIGEEAFFNCESLTSIDLSQCPLEAVGMNAFVGCNSLVEAKLPGSLKKVTPYMFMNCSSLEKLVLPGRAIEINGGAASGTAIKKLIIPNSVSKITYAAFANCKDLEEIQLPASLQTLGEKAFGKCSAVKRIIIDAATPPVGDLQGLLDLDSLKDVTLYVPAASVDKYKEAEGWKNFKNITSLKHYEFTLAADNDLETQITALGEDAVNSIYYMKLKGDISENDLVFINSMPNLIELDMSELNPIDENSILYEWVPNPDQEDMYPLEISFPKGYKNIPESVFANCPMLRRVTFADSVEEIASGAFSNCSWLQTVPDLSKVSIINDWIFAACSSVEEITLAPQTESIEIYAFYNCSSLKNINLGESITEIKELAFANDIALTNIRLPKTVVAMGNNVFLGCSNLRTIYIGAITPPELDGATFTDDQYANATLYVPKSENDQVLQDYKNAKGWGNFKNIKTFEETSTATVMPAQIECLGGKQAIIIRNLTDAPITAQVYTIDGTLVGTVNVSNSVATFAVMPGNYVVSCNGFASKVLVH